MRPSFALDRSTRKYHNEPIGRRAPPGGTVGESGGLEGGGAGGASTRRERVGWYFYDWANSAFSTSVVTVFLGPYLTTVARAAADGNGFVHPFGIAVSAGSFFPYVVSLSVLFQVILL